SRFVNARRRTTTSGEGSAEPFDESELKQIAKWNKIVQKAKGNAQYSYYQMWMASELARAGHVDEAEEMVDAFIAASKEGPQGNMVMLQGLSYLLSSSLQEGKLHPRLLTKIHT